MSERQNLYGTLKAMKKGDTLSLPWFRNDPQGFKADYVRAAVSRLGTEYNSTYTVSATKDSEYITVTRIS